MHKANKGQVVGNLSTRGVLGSPLRKKAEESLEVDYFVARQRCAGQPNHKNRRLVDALTKRLVRRQHRAILRARKARDAAQRQRVRDAETALAEAARAVAEAKRPHRAKDGELRVE